MFRLQKARYLVRSCLTEYGMGDTLFQHRVGEKGETLMQEQFERAKTIIDQNRGALDKMVEILMMEKCLDKKAIDELFAQKITK